MPNLLQALTATSMNPITSRLAFGVGVEGLIEIKKKVLGCLGVEF